uniref:Uncharacterized protein n=1 Tax=Anopheles darlingi TaxID=43151 RepID=A0A2M4D853_ANODA
MQFFVCFVVKHNVCVVGPALWMAGFCAAKKGFPSYPGCHRLSVFLDCLFCNICPTPRRAVWRRFPSNPHRLNDILIYLEARGRFSFPFEFKDGWLRCFFTCSPPTAITNNRRMAECFKWNQTLGKRRKHC